MQDKKDIKTKNEYKLENFIISKPINKEKINRMEDDFLYGVIPHENSTENPNDTICESCQ